MPFTKIQSGINKGKYKSPSGRVYTLGQVKAYYMTDGFKRPGKYQAKNVTKSG